jgi:hypothetical protein
LSDEEAQQIAAFITSKPRPAYPFKRDDYVTSGPPPDAVYYRRAENPYSVCSQSRSSIGSRWAPWAPIRSPFALMMSPIGVSPDEFSR